MRLTVLVGCLSAVWAACAEGAPCDMPALKIPINMEIPPAYFDPIANVMAYITPDTMTYLRNTIQDINAKILLEAITEALYLQEENNVYVGFPTVPTAIIGFMNDQQKADIVELLGGFVNDTLRFAGCVEPCAAAGDIEIVEASLPYSKPPELTIFADGFKFLIPNPNDVSFQVSNFINSVSNAVVSVIPEGVGLRADMETFFTHIATNFVQEESNGILAVTLPYDENTPTVIKVMMQELVGEGDNPPLDEIIRSLGYSGVEVTLVLPTNAPTNAPTNSPTNSPTNAPTVSPTSSTTAPEDIDDGVSAASFLQLSVVAGIVCFIL